MGLKGRIITRGRIRRTEGWEGGGSEWLVVAEAILSDEGEEAVFLGGWGGEGYVWAV